MWTHNMCSVHLLPSSLEVVILKLFGLRTSAHFLTLLRISRELLLTWIISNDIYHAMLCLVSRWCPTLWDSIICSPPGSSVHGILQARILKWVAMPSFRGSSQPRIESRSPHCRWILYCLSRQGSPKILERVAYPFSRESSWPRNWTGVSWIVGGFFTSWATGKHWYLSYYLLN